MTWKTDEERSQQIAVLRPKLTDEFLATLAEAAELSLFDYIEVDGFVIEVFQWAGKDHGPSGAKID